MTFDKTPAEIKALNDIANIKAITCSDKVELFNDLEKENIYTVELTSLSSHAITQLKKCGLVIKSVFVMPNSRMMEAKLVSKNKERTN